MQQRTEGREQNCGNRAPMREDQWHLASDCSSFHDVKDEEDPEADQKGENDPDASGLQGIAHARKATDESHRAKYQRKRDQAVQVDSMAAGIEARIHQRRDENRQCARSRSPPVPRNCP